MKISDFKIAEAVIAHEAVSCFLGKEKPTSRQPAKLVSCTGGVFWGLADEEWPRTANDKPLIPLLQIVCTEMDELFGPFYGMQAVCFFINDEIEGGETRSRTDGADFVAREYTLGVQLKPLQRPAGLEQHKFHRVVWRKTLDYPCISKYYGLFDDLVYSKLCDSKRRRFANHSGIKIGGWPTSVQMSHYPREFDLQIDMTKNYMYGDAGIGYLSAKGGAWYLVFECC